MSDLAAKAFEVTPDVAGKTAYDVVVVGSGVSGSIVAKELSRQGYTVVVIEAGPANDITLADYQTSLDRFYAAVSKDNNAPYATNRNAPMPRSFDTHKLQPGTANTQGYFVQNGPYEIDSTYTRVIGGTTRHWEGKALRMLPEDFKLRTRYGQGLDWPITYDELKSHYRKAERELGVSADVEDQAYGEMTFEDGYVYPMRKMPLSFLDQVMAKDLDGYEVDLDGHTYSLKVRSTPQARNGIPNPDYDGGNGFTPTGAVSLHQAEIGQRCQGNTNCVPICPVQAKYDARRTLLPALETTRVHLLAQTVASTVEIDRDSGRVSGIVCKTYHDLESSEHVTTTVRGTIFVVAGNAVENARLMLASDLRSSSGLIGRNLMDHAYLLTWALMPEPVGTLRGPLCTSGIEDLRGGSFRRRQAAFRFGIHNDGWGWATGGPYSDLDNLVDDQNKFGKALREGLVDTVGRQLLLACMVEVLPDESNRITVDPRYVDQLGNPRPVISFDISPYTLEAVAFGRKLTRRIYQRMGAEDYTSYDPGTYGWFNYQGEGYVIRGGNHWAGTHVMGTAAGNSVVDADQRSWDHENLYLAGAGSMPTIGSSNTTLTLAALCFRSAERIAQDLGAPAGGAA